MKKIWPYLLALVVLLVVGGIYLDYSKTGMDLANLGASQPNQASSGASASVTPNLKNYGPAPDFTGITNWINSPPLTMASLKGKVVLVDFWTYSCINCLRTLPFVTGWYSKYSADGLVVVGVHTPEFPFEQVPANVEAAVKRLGVTYPVAQDNNYGTWNAYQNEYWPADYLVDQNGNVVYESFGEGDYVQTENAIRSLLKLPPLTSGSSGNGQDLSQVNSPEMYFGTARQEYLTQTQKVSTSPTAYTQPAKLSVNTFALGGTWQFNSDNAVLDSATGSVQLSFDSAKLYMVAAAGASPVTLSITVDGVAQPDVTVTGSQLYTLFNSTSYTNHTAVITVTGAGFQAYTFTFG